jgi:hypothetical protein
MRAVGRVAACVCALALVVAILHVALPANKAADEGPADPILEIRRPVVRALRLLGILRFDERFTNKYLPTPSGRTEPVYRGLFWHVGWRITRRVTDHNDLGMRSARLCYAIGDTRFVAAEDEDPAGRSVELTGFVPLEARGYWSEITGADGAVHPVNGCGDVDPFWLVCRTARDADGRQD